MGVVFRGGAKKQKCVALSSTEAEYIAMSEAAKEAVILKDIVNELIGHNDSILMYNDSQSAQKLIRNPVHHSRTKHIDTRYHYIREQVNNSKIVIKYLKTNDMIADIMTKSLPTIKHTYCSENFGLY